MFKFLKIKSILWLLLFFTVVCFSAPIDIDGPTTEWIPFGEENDFNLDQQTGSTEADIAGIRPSDGIHYSLYTQFDDAGTPSKTDGELAFRIRLGREKPPSGYSTAFFIGLDADLNGAIDLFVGVDNSGSGDKIAIWEPGTDLNTSPNTTSIESPPNISYTQTTSNYDWSIVNTTIDPPVLILDVNGDGFNDYFLSFLVPFNGVVNQLDFVGISGIDEDSAVRYIHASATQDNALNQDLGGIDGSVHSTETWEDLGGLSDPISFNGQPIPEPSTIILFILGFIGLGFGWWRKRKK